MQPRVVLVTGGTGVLGSAIVSALCGGVASEASTGPQDAECLSARERYRVIANYRHDEARAANLQRATSCELWRADVGDEAEVEAMFAGLPSLFAVVHAAGISRDSLLLRNSRTAWDETLRINTHGAFLVTRAALAKLQEGGRLLYLASWAGEHGNAGQGAYAASKAAVIALMKCAAREGASCRLSVNAICPGIVPSAMTSALTDEHLAAYENRSVLKRLGTPQQTAATVRWLLSAEAADISAQVIHCDSRI